MSKNIFCLFVITGLLMTSGCGFHKTERLLALKHFSTAQVQAQRSINDQNKKFESLLNLASGDQLKDFKTTKDFISNFGDPIAVKETGSSSKRWLYRYPARYFDSPKVYVFFDDQDQFVKYEVIESKKETQ